MNEKERMNISESPASWNTRYITPEGFICQLTLKADNGRELIDKANGAIATIMGNGCIPYLQNSNVLTKLDNSSHNDGDGIRENKESNPNWCPIHNVPLERREKNGAIWYSHKISDGSWCKGR